MSNVVSTTTGVDAMTKDIAVFHPILMRSVLIAFGLLVACSTTPEVQVEEEAPDTETKEKTTEDALVEMKNILDGYEGDGRADMLYELAELHRTRSRELEKESIRAQDRCFTAEPEDVARCFEEGKQLEEKSLHHREEAERLLEEISTSDPNYEDNDGVLLTRGHLLRELDRHDAAMEQYERLVEEHPHSEHADHAHVAMGDHHFDTREFAKARTHYNAVAESSDPSLAHYVLYKAAWTHYYTEEFRSAVESIQRLIKSLRREDDDEADPMYEQALGDYARFLVRSDLCAKGVQRRLDELKKEDAQPVLERMELLCDAHDDEACEMSKAIE